MEYFKTEVKTGLVVLVCLTLLIILTLGISGTKTIGKTYNITVLFKNIGGLDNDAPVNFSGFEVGKVKHIRLLTPEERRKYPEYNIAVTLTIDSNAMVKEDSVVQIKTLGYLGLKYIDITAGSPDAKPVKPEATILGYTPQDVNEIIEMVGKIIQEINPKIQKILDGIENIVGEKGKLTTIIDELQKLVKDADEVIVVNKGDIKTLISNLTEASQYLKEFANDIRSHPWKLLIKTKEKKPVKRIQTRVRSQRKWKR